MSRVIPNFFIAGAPKGGTTTLSDLIKNHPDVYFSPIKDPCYFARDIVASDFAKWHMKHICDPDRYVANGMGKPFPSIAYIEKEETYFALFSGWSGQRAIGEGSAEYLVSKVAAAEIARVSPQAKIIITLRNPVDRAYSEYLMYVRMGIVNDSFKSALKREAALLARGETSVTDRYLTASLYAQHVQRFLDTFPREQILFLNFDAWKRDPAAALRRVCEHIGVDPDIALESDRHSNSGTGGSRVPQWMNRMFYESGVKEVFSRWAPASIKQAARKLYYRERPSIQSVDEEDREYLRANCAPDIARLQDMIGMDFSGWLTATPDATDSAA